MQGRKGLFSSEEQSHFLPQHIQIIQFIETEKFKRKKELKYKQIMNTEQESLKQKLADMQFESIEDLKQIEKITRMTVTELLFDSSFCNWNERTSTFDSHVLNKEKIVIAIRDEHDTIICGYLNSPITGHCW